MNVPPPPMQQVGGAPSFAPAAAAPGQRSILGRVLLGCGGLLVLAVLFVGCLAVLGSGGGSSSSGQGGSDGNPDSNGGGTPSSGPARAQGASEDQYSSEADSFTRANYGVLVANPDEHVGDEVDITGQLLDNPEQRGDEVAFQMWADPVKIDWSTIVRTDEAAIDLRTDDYVHVRGKVTGSFEGENAFGGTVTAVGVDADAVERVEAVDAIDPTQNTLEVGQTQSNEGFSITIDKVEFGAKHARVLVMARNEGDKGAKLDLYRSKIVQNEDRIGQKDPYDYNLPKPKSGLPPGDETEGVVIFGHTDSSEPFQVSFAWERGGYLADKPDPLVFQIVP